MTQDQNPTTNLHQYPIFATLADGNVLTIHWLGKKNRSLTKAMINAVRGRSKPSMPELILFMRKGMSALCADFDVLPYPFEDWERLESFLKYSLGERGLVFRSASDKVKVLFVVDTAGVNVRLIARDTLSKVLDQAFDDIGSDWIGCIDWRGMGSTYITPSLEKNIGRLSSLLPINPVWDSADDNALRPFKEQFSPTAKQVIAAVGSRLKGKSRNAFEQFIRLLIGTPQLLDAFDLPVIFLAGQVSRLTNYAISASQISRWITRLEEQGWLSCLSEKWKPGVKAKTYCARGELAAMIHSVVEENFAKRWVTHPLPDVIIDAEGKNTIFRAGEHFVELARVNFNQALARFQAWVRRATRNPAKLQERLGRCSEVLKTWLKKNRSEKPIHEDDPMPQAVLVDLNEGSECIGDEMIVPLTA